MIRRRFRSCSGIYLSVISGTHGNAPGSAGRRGSISISSGRPFHLVDLDHRHPVPEGLKLRNRALRTLASNGPCQQQFLHRLEAFHQTAGHHPVVVADPFQSMAARVVKPTDFQSAAGFRENPLYREVDRHLDSRDQIAFTPSHLPDRKVLLTLKRSRGDFSRAAEETPHFTGSCLDGIARAIEEGRGAWSGVAGNPQVRRAPRWNRGLRFPRPRRSRTPARRPSGYRGPVAWARPARDWGWRTTGNC